jgi:hypothetical protein
LFSEGVEEVCFMLMNADVSQAGHAVVMADPSTNLVLQLASSVSVG